MWLSKHTIAPTDNCPPSPLLHHLTTQPQINTSTPDVLAGPLASSPTSAASAALLRLSLKKRRIGATRVGVRVPGSSRGRLVEHPAPSGVSSAPAAEELVERSDHLSAMRLGGKVEYACGQGGSGKRSTCTC